MCFFSVTLPVRTATSNFVSIFDLRRKHFICMDFKGKLYISVSIVLDVLSLNEVTKCQKQTINIISFYQTEAKGQRRLSLPGHLVRFSKPPSCVLLYKREKAAQTTRRSSASGTWRAA